MTLDRASGQALHAFAAKTRCIPVPIVAELSRDPQRDAVVMLFDFWPRDHWRGSVDAAAFRDAGVSAMVDLVRSAIDAAFYVNECREGIRDLIDQ